jgi:hypothetical protein
VSAGLNWLRIDEVFCGRQTIDRLGASELLITFLLFPLITVFVDEPLNA